MTGHDAIFRCKGPPQDGSELTYGNLWPNLTLPRASSRIAARNRLSGLSRGPLRGARCLARIATQLNPARSCQTHHGQRRKARRCCVSTRFGPTGPICRTRRHRTSASTASPAINQLFRMLGHHASCPETVLITWHYTPPLREQLAVPRAPPSIHRSPLQAGYSVPQSELICYYCTIASQAQAALYVILPLLASHASPTIRCRPLPRLCLLPAPISAHEQHQSFDYGYHQPSISGTNAA